MLYDNQEEILLHVKPYFLNTFTHIRAFHATKALNIYNFKKYGIRPLNTQESNQSFLDIFNNYNKFPPINSSQLNSAIEKFEQEINDTTRNKRIYFNLSKNELLTTSGQYLLYGSERILCLANYIHPHSPSYRLFLKNFGQSILLHINVPITQIINIDTIIIELISITNEYYQNRNIDFKSLDLSTWTSQVIDNKYIIKYEYPDTSQIHDPFELQT